MAQPSGIAYKKLVIELLQNQKYPQLEHFVVVDVYFKTIPDTGLVSRKVETFDYEKDPPESVLDRDKDPFRLTYLTNMPGCKKFCLHTIDDAAFHTMTTGQTDCIRVKLTRNCVDDLLGTYSRSFEEEIYTFITMLNFNVPKIRVLLNLDLAASTRFMPQRIRLWAYHYKKMPVQPTCLDESTIARFGPPDRSGSVLSVRLVKGKLSACTSRTVILSLDDDNCWTPSDHPYTLHYVPKWQTLVPLAYNPLENPII